MSDKIPDAPEVKRRDINFAERTRSKICKEIASADNPFVAEKMLWHGYDVLELMDKRSFVDVIFLLLKGELPSSAQSQLFEKTLIMLANPGPRHAATRAVMNASVSKTKPAHFLAIGMALASGEHLGAGEVHNAIKFVRRHLRKNPADVARQRRAERSPDDSEERMAPGFGSNHGSIDTLAQDFASELFKACPDSPAFQWAQQFCDAIGEDGMGWLPTGVAAVAFVELGFTPQAGAGLYQLGASPGLLAHGIEMAGKPLHAMPFVADENYHYQGPTRDE